MPFQSTLILEMIFHTIVRKFCRIATIQLKTAQTAHLVETKLSKNPEAFEFFNKVVEIPEIKFLENIFSSNGYELRMAGGPVRDILCGIQPNDIDFVSNATPNQMINIMSDKQNISLKRTLTGERHGTVIARINDRHQFEITTLQIEKNTDGRHAEVIFTNDWKLDASRRDLTINSMFLDLNGILYDYFNGETDLKNKAIKFVGEAEDRIREDCRRILRYFRFHIQFGCPAKYDPQILAIIKDNLNGLEKISGETILAEMKRILVLRNCSDVINVMFNELQIGKYMGFRPNSVTADHKSYEDFSRDLSEFEKVLSNLNSGVDNGVMTSWEASTLFASLIKDSEEFLDLIKRLKLWKTEIDSILYIITNRQNISNRSLFDLRKQLALSPKPNQHNLKKSIIECLKYCGLFNQISSISEWEIPNFPFTGHLLSGKVRKSQLIKEIIDELKSFWAKSDFKCTEDDLKLEVEKILLKDKYKP